MNDDTRRKVEQWKQTATSLSVDKPLGSIGAWSRRDPVPGDVGGLDEGFVVSRREVEAVSMIVEEAVHSHSKTTPDLFMYRALTAAREELEKVERERDAYRRLAEAYDGLSAVLANTAEATLARVFKKRAGDPVLADFLQRCTEAYEEVVAVREVTR